MASLGGVSEDIRCIALREILTTKPVEPTTTVEVMVIGYLRILVND